MFLSLCLTVLLSVSSLAIKKPCYYEEKAEEYFEEFITTHGKSYQHNEEKQTRFEIFKKNLNQINQLNTFSGGVHGITQFSDLTKEEFAEQCNSCLASPEEGQKSSCTVITDADLTTNQAPPTLDYRQLRAVTPVKNQTPCNTCYAFATIGSLEGAYAMKYRQLVSLSEQQLIDCLPSTGHCKYGGFMTTALSELLMTAGVESDADYPYVARDIPCQAQPAKAKLRVTGCYNFQLRSEEKLKEALFKYGPIAIAINAEPFHQSWVDIVDVNTCPPGKLGHAVLLVGYGTEGTTDYWIIKNSWGTTWGPEQGYVRFVRGHNVCGMMNNLTACGSIA